MEKATDNLKHHHENQKGGTSTNEDTLLFKKHWAFIDQEDLKIGFTYGEWYECDEDQYLKNGIIYEKIYQKKLVPHFYCPICYDWYKASEYLAQCIGDERTLWMANMITHYRHHHITSWNKCWRRNGGFYRSGWFDENDYEQKKKEYNERAKRQIIRKCTAFMNDKGIALANIKKLQDNTVEMLEVAGKKLSSK